MAEFLIDAIIYKIVSTREIEKEDIYIGSTTSSLQDEFQEHVANYNRPFKKEIYGTERLFQKYGPACCKIVLIETFPCNSLKALEKRTKEIIRQL
jgi:hypothetical protein